MRTRLDLHLGRDAILHNPGDDALKAVARRFAHSRRSFRPRLLRHVSSQGGAVDLSLAARRAARLDVARVDQPPDRVGADSQELGGLAYPHCLAHPQNVANAVLSMQNNRQTKDLLVRDGNCKRLSALSSELSPPRSISGCPVRR